MNTYYFNSLDKAGQRSYRMIYDALSVGKLSVTVDLRTDMELISSVLDEFPQLFYLKKNVLFTVGFTGKTIKFLPLFNKNEITKLGSQLEKISSNIISSCINQHQSDYDKAIVLHDYLKKNIKYNMDALQSMNTDRFANSYNVVGALIDKNCVCEGFSLAYKYLCDKAGIECMTVRGKGSSSIFSGSHMWNIVKMNGFYHHVDVTWDNQFSEDQDIPNYGYFGLDDETISKDHTWNRKHYPHCTETPCNYFKINNAVLESKNQLVRYLNDNLKMEQSSIIFRVVRGSKLEMEINSILWETFFEVLQKCKYVRVKDQSMTYIPEQLVYLLKVDYM